MDTSIKIQGYAFSVDYEETTAEAWSKQGYYSVVGMKIELVSLHRKYIFLYFVPTTMFTLTSWVSHLLPPASYPARTSLLVTVFLCQVGVFTSALLNTPNYDKGHLRTRTLHLLSAKQTWRS